MPNRKVSDLVKHFESQQGIGIKAEQRPTSSERPTADYLQDPLTTTKQLFDGSDRFRYPRVIVSERGAEMLREMNIKRSMRALEQENKKDVEVEEEEEDDDEFVTAPTSVPSVNKRAHYHRVSACVSLNDFSDSATSCIDSPPKRCNSLSACEVSVESEEAYMSACCSSSLAVTSISTDMTAASTPSDMLPTSSIGMRRRPRLRRRHSLDCLHRSPLSPPTAIRRTVSDTLLADLQHTRSHLAGARDSCTSCSRYDANVQQFEKAHNAPVSARRRHLKLSFLLATPSKTFSIYNMALHALRSHDFVENRAFDDVAIDEPFDEGDFAAVLRAMFGEVPDQRELARCANEFDALSATLSTR